MHRTKTQVRLCTAFVLCMLVRLIPFRAPNIEPLLSVQMPSAKRHGALTAFLFGFASIFLYDVLTGRVGAWTLITALAYGALGVLAAAYFKNRSASRKHFVFFAIMATIAYDAVTGLTIGPLFFHQSFLTALVGQVPFTALHLLGNIIFAAVLSPAISRWLIYERPQPATEQPGNLISIPITIDSR